jgi:hypothetical protein
MGSDPPNFLKLCIIIPKIPHFLPPSEIRTAQTPSISQGKLRMNEQTMNNLYLTDLFEHTLQIIVIKNLPFEIIISYIK